MIKICRESEICHLQYYTKKYIRNIYYTKKYIRSIYNTKYYSTFCSVYNTLTRLSAMSCKQNLSCLTFLSLLCGINKNVSDIQCYMLRQIKYPVVPLLWTHNIILSIFPILLAAYKPTYKADVAPAPVAWENQREYSIVVIMNQTDKIRNFTGDVSSFSKNRVSTNQ